LISRSGEKLPPETVLKIVTKGAAEAASLKNTGSISNGKKANFINLDRNISTEKEIKSTGVKKTYLEGKMVYDYDDDEDRHAFRFYWVE
jgi:predicted amidohydrolase YtcJ